MSVVEIIRQIQEEAAKKAAEAESARADEWKRTEPERLAAREAQKQREFAKKQQQEEIIRESGIKEKLQQIEREFLQHTNHHLFVAQHAKGDIYYASCQYGDNGIEYELCWGYQKGQEQQNKIYGYDYNSIRVSLNLDSGRIGIYGFGETRWLDKGEWINNKPVIDEALAKAYLSPDTHINYPDTSWSIN